MSSLTRRRGEEDDRAFFVELRREAFPASEGADADFTRMPLEILEQDGRRIGYVCILHEDDHDFLDELALIAAARGRGVGSDVVRAAMESARARGVPLRLSVLSSNPAAKLYERLGFRIFTIDEPRIRMEWP